MEILSEFPACEKSFAAVLDVIAEAATEGRVGCDFEGHHPPTIIGVASRGRMAAWWWDARLGQALVDCGTVLVAYAGIGADKPQLEKALGVVTPNARWSDPYIRHWIVNPDLSSIPKSSLGEDSDSHVVGFGGLFAATSLLHDFPHWKGKRDDFGRPHCIWPAECLKHGWPCPEHDELQYCAADAFAGLWDDYSLRERMVDLAIPESYYDWRVKVGEYCVKMQAKGVRVDQDVIDGLEAAIQSKKATLFPFLLDHSGRARKKKVVVFLAEYESGATIEVVKKRLAPKTCEAGSKLLRVQKVTTITEIPGKKRAKPLKIWQGPFNPNSPKAVLEWFDANGIVLRERGGKPSMGKAVVLKRLEKELRTFGLRFDPKGGEVTSVEGGSIPDDLTLPEPVDLLLRLAQKTCAGKGLSSWFDERYIEHHECHPRFNGCGTLFIRLSSSKPNFQNIPRLGFGLEVRKAVIARPGYKLLKGDLSQLEFRICLWFGERNPDDADGAFLELAQASNGTLLDLATRMGRGATERDVAKTLVHAADMGEGLKLFTAKDLSKPLLIGDRKAKALLVFDGIDAPLWEFRGRMVAFTGANLSERLFGDRTRENRAKALSLQQLYLRLYPEIQVEQRKYLALGEYSREGRLPCGHRVPLYGRSPEDDPKTLMAMISQGGGAIYAQEGMVRFGERGDIANLQVHDELVFEVPVDWTDDKCIEFMEPMVRPSMMLPDFTCPAKLAVGPNWKETRTLGEIRWTGNQLAFKSV